MADYLSVREFGSPMIRKWFHKLRCQGVEHYRCRTEWPEHVRHRPRWHCSKRSTQGSNENLTFATVPDASFS